MRLSTLFPAVLLAAPLSHAAPTPQYDSNHLSANIPGVAKEKDPDKSPWMVYSLREQPFSDAELTFTFSDPNTKYETQCRTALPMSGYATCEDGKTSFIYGGVSYQYGETWLSIQRRDVEDCPDTNNATASEEEKREEHKECKKRSAAGTLHLPGNFWQQPGWNSWVHPEELDVHWSWSS
ncbi:hypothetical protein KVT40_008089 [Elsinoe batatas]|uniref:AA1-like domain-containing protein n=1 Tax=Elsinoe batatas TaxID=2601811 RepID=A0A8K0PDI3_9PEZI|nr:hypothetical protein KVT40_008089 [Elsinoe batatas]